MNSEHGEGAVIRPGTGDALVIVDVQNDFMPGGSLAVADGDRIIGPLKAYLAPSCQVMVAPALQALARAVDAATAGI